jgi:hypothetical protein
MKFATLKGLQYSFMLKGSLGFCASADLQMYKNFQKNTHRLPQTRHETVDIAIENLRVSRQLFPLKNFVKLINCRDKR